MQAVLQGQILLCKSCASVEEGLEGWGVSLVRKNIALLICQDISNGLAINIFDPSVFSLAVDPR